MHCLVASHFTQRMNMYVHVRFEVDFNIVFVPEDYHAIYIHHIHKHNIHQFNYYQHTTNIVLKAVPKHTTHMINK